MQSDQRLCCLLLWCYNTYTYYIQISKALANFCRWAGQFESYLLATPEDRFYQACMTVVAFWWMCSSQTYYHRVRYIKCNYAAAILHQIMWCLCLQVKRFQVCGVQPLGIHHRRKLLFSFSRIFQFFLRSRTNSYRSEDKESNYDDNTVSNFSCGLKSRWDFNWYIWWGRRQGLGKYPVNQNNSALLIKISLLCIFCWILAISVKWKQRLDQTFDLLFLLNTHIADNLGLELPI